MHGAVPCLSTDLTTHTVPHFIQALKMGRRTAPKALSDPARGAVMSELSETRADNGQGREARLGLQPGEVRGSLRRAAAGEGAEAQDLQPGDVRSSLRRAAAGEGAEAHDLQPGEVLGACRRERRRWGARSAVRRRGDVFLGACRHGRRRGGLQLY